MKRLRRGAALPQESGDEEESEEEQPLPVVTITEQGGGDVPMEDEMTNSSSSSSSLPNLSAHNRGPRDRGTIGTSISDRDYLPAATARPPGSDEDILSFPPRA